MTSLQNDVVAQLEQAIGAGQVMATAEDMAPWLSDWRGLYKGNAQAVLRPRDTAQVAAALAICHATGTPVVPRGGNTGLCGAATPDANPNNVVISLDRMNAIRSVDAIANTMVAEAGCILSDLHDAAAQAGRLLPLSLAAQGSCQLGGNLATNAGGVNVVRYGMTRELVLGLEAVLPTGEIWHGLRTLRKDNTGYDLKQLFIGSEGTLGIITAAAVRLFAPTPERAVVIAAVESPQKALQLFELLYAMCGSRLQAFEYFTDECVGLVLQHAHGVRKPFPDAYPGYVLLELADTGDAQALEALMEKAITAAIEQEVCVDAILSASLSQVEEFWKLREEISEAQRADGPHLKHDISLPIEAIPQFMAETEAKIAQAHPGLRLFVFGHFGDGNLHYNISRPEGTAANYFAENGTAVTDLVLDEVMKFGGSISAEHGIGQLKREHFLHTKAALDLRLMRGIKNVFDPKGIMNPGKVF